MTRRRAGPRALVRVLVVLVITAASLMLMSALLARFDVDNAASALVAAALIGLINALVWPVLIRIALPFTVLTLGLGVLVLNGGVVLFVAGLDPGVTIDGLGTAIVVALGLTVVNTAVTSLLAIDD